MSNMEGTDSPPRRGLRAFLYHYLEPGVWPRTGLSPANKLVAVLIVFASLVAVWETEAELHGWYLTELFVLEIVFTILFSVEYVARLYAAGENPRFRGLKGRVRYFFTWWALVDLMAVLPFILTLGSENTMLIRLLKLMRIFRLAKLGKFTNAWEVLTEAVRERRYELMLTSGVAAVLLLLSSTLLYLAEGPHQPEAFGSIPRALWWSVVTLTTVGYGDATPLTGLGRFFAALTAFSGVGLIAMPTGILAAAFSSAFQRRKK